MISNVNGNYREERRTTSQVVENASNAKKQKTTENIIEEQQKNSGKKDVVALQRKEEKKMQEQKRIRKLKDAIDRANQETRMKQTACEFSFDDATNRIAIKVKDKETDEVIREIPAEETLEMLARIKEQAGLLLDERL